MNPLTTLARWFVPQPDEFHQRSEFPSLDEAMADVLRHRYGAARPWREASVDEALGVPAIFRAVSLITSSVGMLSLEAFRLGVRLDQEDTPRLVQRPNPFSTAEEFWAQTAYSRATRGEAWWWIAARDGDGNPASLYPVNPVEITVTEGPNPLEPDIHWREKQMRLWSPVNTNGNMVHLPLMREPGALRGFGPLQKCGAAVSVAVESQEWAANFFAGSTPSIIGQTDQDLDSEDFKKLDEQWNEKPPNLPRWVDKGLDVKDFGMDPQKAQLTDTRNFQDGAVAQMFGIPGSLLEHNAPGSSLTYTNNEQEYIDFLKGCLRPYYLNPVEQKFQDLLTRTMSVEFSTDVLLRADIKTRFEVHKTAIESGVYDAAYAQQLEGIAPGDIETAAVPYALPAAIPAQLPFERSALEPAFCSKCRKRLANSAPPGWSTTCPRCKTENSIPLVHERSEPQTIVQAPDLTPVGEGMVAIARVLTAMEASHERSAEFMARPQVPQEIHLSIPQAPSPNLNFAEGAFHSETPITVEQPNITVEAAPTPNVTIEPPQINVAPAAPANVEVYPPPINVSAPNVTVNVPEQRPTSKKIKRDKEGHISQIIEEPI
jgi:HK97 family phage portal protein